MGSCQSVLIIGNGDRVTEGLRFRHACDNFTIVHCNRIFPEYPTHICFRNLNSDLGSQTGLTWRKAVTHFREVKLSFASVGSVTCFDTVFDFIRQAEYSRALLETGVCASQCSLTHSDLTLPQYLHEKLDGALPTTGCVAIHEYLRQGYEVFITGFNFFNDSVRIGSHEPIKEKALVMSLVEDHQVFIL